MARFTPWVVTPSIWDLVSSVNLLAVIRPEPTVNIFRLQIRASLATLKITQTTGGPDIRHIVLLYQPENEIILLLRFKRN
uniref:Putative secreted protein n=1 Tax=Anopheles marajoara TaxID=58244 RepID=A0A2M4CBW5_9DIPT